MKSKRLTFYLLNENVVNYRDAIDSDKTEGVVALKLDASRGIDGCFYYIESCSNIPAWVEFVQQVLSEKLDSILSSSTAALLLLRVSDRIFALTFGYGRFLLDLSKIEYQFGLRVALNLINPRQIRSLGTKIFQDLVISNNIQASKSVELSSFGMDP